MNWKIRIAIRVALAVGLAVTALARAARGEQPLAPTMTCMARTPVASIAACVDGRSLAVASSGSSGGMANVPLVGIASNAIASASSPADPGASSWR